MTPQDLYSLRHLFRITHMYTFWKNSTTYLVLDRNTGPRCSTRNCFFVWHNKICIVWVFQTTHVYTSRNISTTYEVRGFEMTHLCSSRNISMTCWVRDSSTWRVTVSSHITNRSLQFVTFKSLISMVRDRFYWVCDNSWRVTVSFYDTTRFM